MDTVPISGQDAFADPPADAGAMAGTVQRAN